jgi:hypothetical protein
VAIRAHNEQIGAEGRCLRQQNPTHVLTARRQKLDVHFRAVKQQVACDVSPRLLTVTFPLVLRINDQDFYSVCTRKQREGIRYGADGLARRVPT